MRLKKSSWLMSDFLFSSGAILLLLLPLSGCESNGSAIPKVLHSCELITVAEIETIIDAKIDIPPRETHKEDGKSNFWMSMCNYYAPESGASLGIMIQPLAQSDSVEEAFDSYVASLKSGMPEYQMSPVDDIGRKAIWNVETGQLTIFNDGYMILISSMRKGGSNEERLVLARKLGSMTLAKLP